jgi:chromosome segregation ATPase
MRDSSKRADDSAGNVKALQQSYALRGWLTALLIQTRQAEATIKYRIAELEQEAQRLRVQLDQMTPAIGSLEQTIHSVDEAIRRRRDEIDVPAATMAARSAETKTQPRDVGQEPRAATRSDQRTRPRRG